MYSDFPLAKDFPFLLFAYPPVSGISVDLILLQLHFIYCHPYMLLVSP